MAAMPFLLFPVVLLLAGTLAFIHHSQRRLLAAANLALAIFAALLIVNEAIAYKFRSSIRVDLLLTLPAVSLAALAVGATNIKARRDNARIVAIALATCGGAALATFGFFFVRTGLDAAEQSRQYFTGNRLYWEETIRCQEAMVERFGNLDREDDPCTGNLRVASRTGGYPFTRVIVTDQRDIYLMFSPEAGVETVYGIEDTWPFKGSDTREGVTAQGTATSGALKINLRRASGTCEAAITQQNGSSTLMGLAREKLPTCPDARSKPVQSVGVWSTMEPIGSQHLRLVQLWLWTSSAGAWAMLADSNGVIGQERRFNFVKRFHGKALGGGRYELRPYSNLDGNGSITITLNGGSVQLGLSDPPRAFELDKSAQLTHAKIRVAPLYDAERFAAYFDSVLRLVDIPWTPAASEPR